MRSPSSIVQASAGTSWKESMSFQLSALFVLAEKSPVGVPHFRVYKILPVMERIRVHSCWNRDAISDGSVEIQRKFTYGSGFRIFDGGYRKSHQGDGHRALFVYFSHSSSARAGNPRQCQVEKSWLFSHPYAYHSTTGTDEEFGTTLHTRATSIKLVYDGDQPKFNNLGMKLFPHQFSCGGSKPVNTGWPSYLPPKIAHSSKVIEKSSFYKQLNVQRQQVHEQLQD